MRHVLFGVLLATAAPAFACPMADAAAYAAELEKVRAASGTKAAFAVEGMHCGSCSSLISSTLMQMPGVAAAAVDYQSGHVEVAFDASKMEVGKMMVAIQALGYKAAVSKPS